MGAVWPEVFRRGCQYRTLSWVCFQLVHSRGRQVFHLNPQSGGMTHSTILLILEFKVVTEILALCQLSYSPKSRADRIRTCITRSVFEVTVTIAPRIKVVIRHRSSGVDSVLLAQPRLPFRHTPCRAMGFEPIHLSVAGFTKYPCPSHPVPKSLSAKSSRSHRDGDAFRGSHIPGYFL